MKKRLVFIIVPIAIIFMAAIVFFALWLAQGRPDYKAAANHVASILSQEDAIMTHINSESGFTFDEIDRESIDSFKNATANIAEYFESLGAGTAQNDKEVASRYAALTPLINKLTEISEAENALVSYVDKVNSSGYASANSELTALKSSPNEFIAALGADLSSHFAKTAAFEAEYKSGKAADYNKMIEAYGVLILEGRALNEKYAAVTLEQVFGITPQTIADYFTKLKDLKTYLEQKN